VLILYSTAVVEPDGEVRFFRDIYGYDSEMEKELAGSYPYSHESAASAPQSSAEP
jgi:murein L,D-transpeptidase YcbB/YkuD